MEHILSISSFEEIMNYLKNEIPKMTCVQVEKIMKRVGFNTGRFCRRTSPSCYFSPGTDNGHLEKAPRVRSRISRPAGGNVVAQAEIRRNQKKIGIGKQKTDRSEFGPTGTVGGS